MSTNIIGHRKKRIWNIVRTIREYYQVEGTSKGHAIEQLQIEGSIAHKVEVVSERVTEYKPDAIK